MSLPLRREMRTFEWLMGDRTEIGATVGDRCTRACGVCAVTTAKPLALEEDEPQRVAEAVRRLELKHLVKPSVDAGLNPYHYLLVRVDGENLDMQVISVDWGKAFEPYRSNKIALKDD